MLTAMAVLNKHIVILRLKEKISNEADHEQKEKLNAQPFG
jgi:hypothetical protein